MNRRFWSGQLQAAQVRVLAHPVVVSLQRMFPDVDPRVWLIGFAVLGLGAVAVKETPLPRAVLSVGLLLGLIMLGWLSRRHPEMLLYAFIGYVPFSRLIVGHMGTQLAALNLMNVLLIWLVIAYAVHHRDALRFPRAVILMDAFVILFVGLSVLAWLRAGWCYGASYAWDLAAPLKRWLMPVTFYFFVLWMVRDLRTLKTILVLIMGVVTVVALMALWEYVNNRGGSLEHSRARGIADDPNLLGAFFAYYMFLFLGWVFAVPAKRAGWVMGVPFLLVSRGIMVTFSRGAYFAAAAGILAASWLRSTRLFIAAVVLGVVMWTHPVLLPEGIRYRLNQTVRSAGGLFGSHDVTQHLEPSAARRLAIWQAGVQIVKDHPWWGVGFGAFRRFVPHYTHGAIDYRDAHNVYLSIASEMGLPALLVFFLLLGTAAYEAHWLYRHTQDAQLRAMSMGFLAGMVALLVANFFSPCMSSEEVIGYFWILCALVMRAVHLERQKIGDGGQEAADAAPVPCPMSHVPGVVRVCYVIDHLDYGGAQHQLVELTKALPKSRYDVHIISLSADQLAYVQTIRDAGLRLTLIPHAGRWSWRTLARLLTIFHRERPALVHTWLFTADLYGRLAAWLVRVPVTVSAVRSVEPDKPSHYVQADRLLRHVTDAFTINAKAIGEVLATREHVNASKLYTIYNGVDLQTFDPTREDGAVRSRIGVDRRAPLIGIVGRLVPVKDHETFLRAAALIVPQAPHVRFLIIGDGPCRASLERLARELGLGSSVHFLESQPHVAETFAALDLVVVSSRYEGCCNVILEAMAMGRPVVATAVGGNPELVITGKTGLLVPPMNPEHLSEAILQLVRQPQLARAMGREGRARIEQHFGLERMVRETTALYDRLLCETPRFRSCPEAGVGVAGDASGAPAPPAADAGDSPARAARLRLAALPSPTQLTLGARARSRGRLWGTSGRTRNAIEREGQR